MHWRCFSPDKSDSTTVDQWPSIATRGFPSCKRCFTVDKFVSTTLDQWPLLPRMRSPAGKDVPSRGAFRNQSTRSRPADTSGPTSLDR